MLISVNHNNPEELKKVEKLQENLVKRALEMEGTCSGEHGIGVGKRKYLKEEKSQETYNFMKEIKNFVDPKNIFNPGKIFFLEEEFRN